MPWTDLSRLLPIGAMLAAALASPAMAASEPSTRLVSCGTESCLLVSGYRGDSGAPVRINGRPVAVEGSNRWRVRVPVAAVRAWSAPYARTITVSVAEAPAEADLPIGLLGHVTDLAALTIRVK
ncbi:hypothetical protein WG901_20430 [Novosphingobium sp. PS1R-30]|uniref:Uncharacterized protein n=1 Tax=Novosphingobium anseongense TaxID=3133436 RepID=A0ABU8S101_9SPHN